MIRLDHFILGVKDLETARKDFQKRSGVMPLLGGQHPSLGTHNALISLGETLYFEFLAADVTLNVTQNGILEKVTGLTAPKFIGWAISCTEFSEISEILKNTTGNLSPVGSGSRKTPEGNLLKYEFADILGFEHLGVAVPFVVRWINSTHPAKTSPHGCQLKKAVLNHQASPSFSSLIQSLNLGITLCESDQNSLEVSLKTPKGEVKFK